MGLSKDSQISKYEKTADYYKKKADREWAYAKNGEGGEHYQKVREAYAKVYEQEKRT